MSPLRLSDLTINDAARAGRKAAALGEMLRAGMPVPAGFVALVDDSDAAIDAAAAALDGRVDFEPLEPALAGETGTGV